MPLPKILRELLSLPTATFVESAVLDYVRRFCRRTAGVRLKPDRYGNLLARYRYRPGPVTPLVFSAHADHPGFVAQEMLDDQSVSVAARAANSISILEDISQDPNMPMYSRTRVWNAISVLEGIRD